MSLRAPLTRMEDIFVGRLMSAPVYTVGEDASLSGVGREMLDRGIGSAVVVEGEDRLVGILTATDFVRVVAEGGTDPETSVSAVMSTDVVTAGVNDSVQGVADLMLEHGFHHVPVVDDGTVVGIVTTTDLTAYVSTGPEAFSS
jgi:CBS domain-containing protein